MGVPQKWMVYNGKSYQNDKMDDFGVPPFLETYIYIWAANHICYITQLTGCSYLVLQSRNVFAYLVLGVFLPRFTS